MHGILQRFSVIEVSFSCESFIKQYSLIFCVYKSFFVDSCPHFDQGAQFSRDWLAVESVDGRFTSRTAHKGEADFKRGTPVLQKLYNAVDMEDVAAI